MSSTSARLCCRATRIDENIPCDGLSGKPVWDRAEPVRDFVEPWAATRGPVRTEVRLLWNAQCLFVRFDSHGAELAARRTRRHSDVCNDSCVEMFISPFLDAPERYFTFEINALGTMLNRKMDLAASPPLKDPWFPIGMRIGHSTTGVAADIAEPTAWSVELAVPWSQFTIGPNLYRPETGSRWRVNFMRCGGKRLNPFLMWSPALGPKPSYHQPAYFGDLEFR